MLCWTSGLGSQGHSKGSPKVRDLASSYWTYIGTPAARERPCSSGRGMSGYCSGGGLVAATRGQERVYLEFRRHTGAPFGVCKPRDNQGQAVTGMVGRGFNKRNIVSRFWRQEEGICRVGCF